MLINWYIKASFGNYLRANTESSSNSWNKILFEDHPFQFLAVLAVRTETAAFDDGILLFIRKLVYPPKATFGKNILMIVAFLEAVYYPRFHLIIAPKELGFAYLEIRGRSDYSKGEGMENIRAVLYRISWENFHYFFIILYNIRNFPMVEKLSIFGLIFTLNTGNCGFFSLKTSLMKRLQLLINLHLLTYL